MPLDDNGLASISGFSGYLVVKFCMAGFPRRHPHLVDFLTTKEKTFFDLHKRLLLVALDLRDGKRIPAT